MDKIRKIIPLILIIWPYVIVLAAILFDPIAYIVPTLIVYAVNIWNAWTCPAGKRSPFFYDMTVKLTHIPFYLMVFVVGILLAFAMVVPAFLLVSPILIGFLGIIDLCIMLTSSMYGISAVVRLTKRNLISKKTALLHIILHLFFVTDVISAVYLYKKYSRCTVGRSIEPPTHLIHS